MYVVLVFGDTVMALVVAFVFHRYDCTVPLVNDDVNVVDCPLHIIFVPTITAFTSNPLTVTFILDVAEQPAALVTVTV